MVDVKIEFDNFMQIGTTQKTSTTSGRDCTVTFIYLRTYWLNCTTQSLLRQPCVFLRVSVCVCTCVYVCTLLKAKLCCPPCYRVITCISCKEKSNFSATGGAAVILATRKKFIKSFDIQIPCCTLHMASTLQRLPSLKSL